MKIIENTGILCKYFKGDVPCIYHKTYSVSCPCKYFTRSLKILIIKLGAIGDVIRTTPVITRLLELYPNAEISWLTKFTDILPDNINSLGLNFENIEILKASYFDILFNLDKDLIACSLTYQIPSRIKQGFTIYNGKCVPINKNAEYKYLTGIDDNLSKNNKKHYVEEIFEICDIGEFNNEEYIINKTEIDPVRNEYFGCIGLNTGCSPRWSTRLWPEEYWINLAKDLRQEGYSVILLGGKLEHKKNERISVASGTDYFGYGDIESFIYLIDCCDLIVTQVTSALHIAIALKRRIVLMNNIFNKNEFYLYGLGEIIEPKTGCDCFYSPKCEREHHCMKDISVEEIVEAVRRNLC